MQADDTVMDSGSFFRSPAETKAAAQAEQDGRRALRERSDAWAEHHKALVKEVERDLLRDCGDVGPDHALLTRMAAIEAVLSARLADLELQLIERACTLVDNPAHVATLARTLKDVVAVNGAIGGRMEALLGSASILRAQRELAGKPRSHLRAVA